MKYSLLLMTAAVSALAVSCSGQSANNGTPQAVAPAAQANPVAAQPAVAAPTPAAPAPAAAPAAAPVAAPAAAPAPATRPYSGGHKTLYVTTRSGGPLNLRASGSTSSAVVGSLPYGSAVAPYAEDMSGQWYQVTAQNGQRGWVSSSYVTRNMPAPVAAAPAPARPATGGTGSYSGSKYRSVSISSGTLNLRAGGGGHFPVIGSLSNGQSVQILSENAGWAHVATSSGEGYVATRYLR